MGARASSWRIRFYFMAWRMAIRNSHTIPTGRRASFHAMALSCTYSPRIWALRRKCAGGYSVRDLHPDPMLASTILFNKPGVVPGGSINRAVRLSKKTEHAWAGVRKSGGR